jgi:RNA polymerase sigma-70 factor, ECF subfamily
VENDDVSLARLAAGGDRAAFEEIYARHFDLVWYVARGRLGDESDAKDVVQDTFIKAHRGINGFRGPNLSAWLRQICTHLCDDFHKRVGRRARVAPMLALEECLHGQAQSENDIDSIIDRSLIRSAFAELSDEQRDAYVKVKIYGYAAQEVADERGVPASTVRSQVSAARRRLHAALQRELDELTIPIPGKPVADRDAAAPSMPKSSLLKPTSGEGGAGSRQGG